MEVPIPIPINARDPFLRILKRMGPTMDLVAARQSMATEREALAPKEGLSPKEKIERT